MCRLIIHLLLTYKRLLETKIWYILLVTLDATKTNSHQRGWCANVSEDRFNLGKWLMLQFWQVYGDKQPNLQSLLSHSGDKKLTPDISFWQDYFRMICSSQHSGSIPFEKTLFGKKGLSYFWTTSVFFLGFHTGNWIQLIPKKLI